VAEFGHSFIDTGTDGSAAGVDVEELAGAGFGAGAAGLRCTVPDGGGGDCTISADTFTGELLTSAASRGGSVGSLAANGAVVGSFWPATDGSDEDLSRVISDFIDRQLIEAAAVFRGTIIGSSH
jgi:hypothetical protein